MTPTQSRDRGQENPLQGQRKAGNKEQEHKADRTSGGWTPEQKDVSRGATERAALLGTVRR